MTIDQFLRAIDVAEAQMRSSLKGYAEVAVGRDSNVSSGPANANVAVPNIGGVVLSANAVKRGATFGNLAAEITRRTEGYLQFFATAAFECGGDFGQGELEVGGGSDIDLRKRGARQQPCEQ